MRQLLPKLLAFAERDEEGVRNVVAECLGRLTAVAPATVIPKLKALLPSPVGATRSTVISCVRFAITEIGSAPLPPELQGSLFCFLQLLEDIDLKVSRRWTLMPLSVVATDRSVPNVAQQVRRGALLTLNCLAHNKPAAIKEVLSNLLPLLYGETAKRPELVHQVRAVQ